MYGTLRVHDDQFIIPSLISVSAAIMQQSLSSFAHSSAEQPAPEEAVPRRGVEGAAQAEEVHQEQERLPQARQVGQERPELPEGALSPMRPGHSP